MSILQQDFAAKVKDGYLTTLDKTTAEVKDYQALKRKLESRRLDYDAKLGKVQKAKKERPDLEQEMQAAKTKYEDTETDLRNKMITFVESEEDAYRDITEFLDTELAYYRSVTELLENLHATWASGEAPAPSTKPARPIPARSPSNPSRPARNGNIHTDDETSDYFGYQDEASTGVPARSPGQNNLGVQSTQAQRRLAPSSRSGSTDNLNTLPPKRSPSFTSNLTEDSVISARNPPTPAPKKKPTLPPARKQVRAVFDFDGENSEELSFRIGNVITVTEDTDEGWWKGEIIAANGSRQHGIFPVNYTEEIVAPAPPPMPSRPAATSRNYSSSAPAPIYQSAYADEPEEDEYGQVEDEASSPFDDTPSHNIRPAPATPSIRRTAAPPPANTSPRTTSNYVSSQATASRSRSPAPPPPPSIRSVAQSTRSASPRSAAATSTIVRSGSTGYLSGNGSGAGSPSASPAGTPAEGISCGECGCDDFSPNLFKKGQCNNCFHKH
ncbi:hypothetical protein BC936DRAFT_138983 [Jimgerdemannia flammicorona]|uniref:SH3 domain-containing protein n=1 Tax=Jimgerdemannia flammicorona TaxID=994334 RepID=A0A433BBA5_9FUNG|nr:hypothetical protein BC936DRAFT_138983 [Jimgerdemannia flammicorona]